MNLLILSVIPLFIFGLILPVLQHIAPHLPFDTILGIVGILPFVVLYLPTNPLTNKINGFKCQIGDNRPAYKSIKTGKYRVLPSGNLTNKCNVCKQCYDKFQRTHSIHSLYKKIKNEKD